MFLGCGLNDTSTLWSNDSSGSLHGIRFRFCPRQALGFIVEHENDLGHFCVPGLRPEYLLETYESLVLKNLKNMEFAIEKFGETNFAV